MSRSVVNQWKSFLTETSTNQLIDKGKSNQPHCIERILSCSPNRRQSELHNVAKQMKSCILTIFCHKQNCQLDWYHQDISKIKYIYSSNKQTHTHRQFSLVFNLFTLYLARLVPLRSEISFQGRSDQAWHHKQFQVTNKKGKLIQYTLNDK